MRALPPTSRTARDCDPRLDAMAAWLDGSMVAPLLAELIDCVNLERWEYACSCARKGQRKPRRPRPVPRPWLEEDKGETRIGRDPIPVGEFEGWWESKGR